MRGNIVSITLAFIRTCDYAALTRNSKRLEREDINRIYGSSNIISEPQNCYVLGANIFEQMKTNLSQCDTTLPIAISIPPNSVFPHSLTLCAGIHKNPLVMFCEAEKNTISDENRIKVSNCLKDSRRWIIKINRIIMAHNHWADLVTNSQVAKIEAKPLNSTELFREIFHSVQYISLATLFGNNFTTEVDALLYSSGILQDNITATILHIDHASALEVRRSENMTKHEESRSIQFPSAYVNTQYTNHSTNKHTLMQLKVYNAQITIIQRMLSKQFISAKRWMDHGYIAVDRMYRLHGTTFRLSWNELRFKTVIFKDRVLLLFEVQLFQPERRMFIYKCLAMPKYSKGKTHIHLSTADYIAADIGKKYFYALNEEEAEICMSKAETCLASTKRQFPLSRPCGGSELLGFVGTCRKRTYVYHEPFIHIERNHIVYSTPQKVEITQECKSNLTSNTYQQQLKIFGRGYYIIPEHCSTIGWEVMQNKTWHKCDVCEPCYQSANEKSCLAVLAVDTVLIVMLVTALSLLIMRYKRLKNINNTFKMKEFNTYAAIEASQEELYASHASISRHRHPRSLSESNIHRRKLNKSIEWHSGLTPPRRNRAMVSFQRDPETSGSEDEAVALMNENQRVAWNARHDLLTFPSH
jgi:hypothetical protein